MTISITIGLIFGLAGASALSYKMPELALWLWIVGNGALLYHNIQTKDRNQMLLFLGYSILNLIGIVNYFR